MLSGEIDRHRNCWISWERDGVGAVCLERRSCLTFFHRRMSSSVGSGFCCVLLLGSSCSPTYCSIAPDSKSTAVIPRSNRYSCTAFKLRWDGSSVAATTCSSVIGSLWFNDWRESVEKWQRIHHIVDKNIIDCLSATVAFSATPPICAGGGQKFRCSAAFGAPIENFGGGGAWKNSAAAARPARRRALVSTVSCGSCVDAVYRSERRLWLSILFSVCGVIYGTRAVMPLCVVAVSQQYQWSKTEMVHFRCQSTCW